MTKTLRTPNTLSLSLANMAAAAVMVNWNADPDQSLGEFGRENIGVPLVYESDYEIYLPTPTFGAVSDYAADLLNKRQQATAFKSPGRPLPDDLKEAFQDSDGYHEWRSSYDPMMNYVWPVNLGYQVDAQTAADLIEEFAGAVVLVKFDDKDRIGEEYGIALTGGGMNLADHIATAYLCCGCVPPERLLNQLPGVVDDYRLKTCGPALRKAYAEAAKYYKRLADNMKRDSARVFKKEG